MGPQCNWECNLKILFVTTIFKLPSAIIFLFLLIPKQQKALSLFKIKCLEGQIMYIDLCRLRRQMQFVIFKQNCAQSVGNIFPCQIQHCCNQASWGLRGTKGNLTS